MLTVLTSSLSDSARGVLEEGIAEAFNNAATIEELTESNLKTKVRLASKSPEIVLVILNQADEDTCLIAGKELLSSSKYYKYESNEGLATFLNNKYNLNIVVAEEVVENNECTEKVIDDSVISDLKNELALKNGIIANLEAQLKEMHDMYDFDDSAEEVVGKGLEATAEAEGELSKQIEDLKSEVEELKGNLVDMEVSLKKAQEKNEELSSELTESKVTYSMQTGLIRDKSNKIEELEGKLKKESERITELETFKEDNKGIVCEYEAIKKSLADKEVGLISLRAERDTLDKERGNLQEKLNSFDSEKQEYEGKLADLNGDLAELRGNLDKKDNEISSLNGKIKELQGKLKESQEAEMKLLSMKEDMQKKDTAYSKLQGEKESLEGKVSKLEGRIAEDDKNITELNSEVLRLNSLTKVSGSKEELNNLIDENEDLKISLKKYRSSAYARLTEGNEVYKPPKLNILNNSKMFSNIQFIFSGSTDSRKGTYKCLLNECLKDRNSKYLIVDLVSETSIDYVFEIKKVVTGKAWLKKGGDVEKHLSNTILSNVKVLAMGLGYINDSNFLLVDWNKRLEELNNSGYNVLLYCGDISNIIGRTLHESFAGNGISQIYVQSAVVSIRALITNLRGISNHKESTVFFYDYKNTDSINKFYSMVESSNECKKIIDYSGKR